MECIKLLFLEKRGRNYTTMHDHSLQWNWICNGFVQSNGLHTYHRAEIRCQEFLNAAKFKSSS